MNWEKLESEFVAEGWGNGSLHPRVVRNPIGYWDDGFHEDDFYVGYDFHFNDWEALFVEGLNVAKWDEYVEGEDINKRYERAWRKFRESIPEYPLLARIFDMYADAAYGAEEVHVLLEECRKAQDKVNPAGAQRALNKLILACNKASERGMGLRLISD